MSDSAAPLGAEAVRPAGYAQESMWYEQQFRRHGSNIGCQLVTVRGAAPDEAVREACLAVVRRHPTLRSVFTPRHGTICQVVGPAETAFAFEAGELACPAGGEHQPVRDWVRSRYGRWAWDLGRRPPVRFHLLRHDGDRATLAVVVHHIGYDGRSKFLFAHDFTRYLDDILAGREIADPPLRLPPDPSSPAQAELIDETVRYWERLAESGLGHTLLPRRADVAEPEDGTVSSDGVPTDGVSADGTVLSTARFDVPSAPELRALAHEAGTSLFGALLACAAIQLVGYGNPVPVLSITVDTSTPDTAGLIGLDVNVVPVAVRIGPGHTARDALAAARDALRTLDERRRVPFQVLLRAAAGSGAARRAGADDPGGPFNGVSLSYPRVPADLPKPARVELDWDFFVPNFGTAFDATFQFRSEAAGCYGRVDYVARTHGTPAADALVRDFGAVVRTVLAHPDRPIGSLDLPGLDPAAESPHRNGYAARGRTATTGPPRPADTAPADTAGLGPVRENMLAIWRGVLGIDDLGLNDDFFAVGGHSLLAMELLARVEEQMGVALLFADLAERPTAEGLSQAVERAMPAAPRDRAAGRREG